MKFFSILTAINGGFLGHEVYVFILQIVPGKNPENVLVAYLISAIVTLASVIVFLSMYAKSLNKIIKTTVETAYQNQIKDHKEVIQKNTEAFIENTAASRTMSTSNTEVKDAIVDLRLWLTEKMK